MSQAEKSVPNVRTPALHLSTEIIRNPMRIDMRTIERKNEALREIRVDSTDMLMNIFNTINEEKESEVFTYKEVKFWREDYEFIMSYNEEAFLAGVVTDFDEFKEMLLDQKL